MIKKNIKYLALCCFFSFASISNAAIIHSNSRYESLSDAYYYYGGFTSYTTTPSIVESGNITTISDTGNDQFDAAFYSGFGHEHSYNADFGHLSIVLTEKTSVLLTGSMTRDTETIPDFGNVSLKLGSINLFRWIHFQSGQRTFNYSAELGPGVYNFDIGSGLNSESFGYTDNAYWTGGWDYTITLTGPAPVPLPSASLLFLSSVLGLFGFRQTKKRQLQHVH